MRLIRRIAIAVIMIATACCASTYGQAVPTKNAVLLNATSPFEDLVDFGLAKNDAAIETSLAAVLKQAAAVRKVLSADAGRRFDALVVALGKAAGDKSYAMVADQAVEAFRVLIENLDAAGLRVPKEVSLLDYAGFKIRVLAAAPQPDWNAMRKTVGEAGTWWNAMKAKVSSRGLSDAFGSTVRGLQEASRSENLPMVRFAAQMDLDLVDVLEAHFEH